MITDLMDTKLFISRTVNQLISGYEDELLLMAKESRPDKVKSSRISLTLEAFIDSINSIFKIFNYIISIN